MYEIKNNNGILQTPDTLDTEPDPKGWGAHLFYKMTEFSDKTAQVCKFIITFEMCFIVKHPYIYVSGFEPSRYAPRMATYTILYCLT